MKDENVEWVKDWVEAMNKEQGHKLTPAEVHKAAVIGNEMFHGNVGVGHAAEAGINAVKKLRE